MNNFVFHHGITSNSNTVSDESLPVILQPMDMGLISVAKTNYKYNLLCSAIKAAEGTEIGLVDYLKTITILGSNYLLILCLISIKKYSNKVSLFIRCLN